MAENNNDFGTVKKRGTDKRPRGSLRITGFMTYGDVGFINFKDESLTNFTKIFDAALKKDGLKGIKDLIL